MLREAKRNFFRRINPRYPKEFWKACKMLNWASTSIPTLQTSCNIAPNEYWKGTAFKLIFASCFNNAFAPLKNDDFLSIPCPDSIPEDLLCNEIQICDMLASLDASKSNGPDNNIPARMLKATAASIAPSVASLFNLSLKLGRVPLKWKESRVVPIPKVPAPKTPDNFRPISLLSVLSKVLEKHIYGLIASHLDMLPLSDSQWGFRIGHSTVSALLSIVDDWLKLLEEGKEICISFFDNRKAFDSVPHRPLIENNCLLSTWTHHSLPVDIWLPYWQNSASCSRRCNIKCHTGPLRSPSGIDPWTFSFLN